MKAPGHCRPDMLFVEDRRRAYRDGVEVFPVKKFLDGAHRLGTEVRMSSQVTRRLDCGVMRTRGDGHNFGSGLCKRARDVRTRAVYTAGRADEADPKSAAF